MNVSILLHMFGLLLVNNHLCCSDMHCCSKMHCYGLNPLNPFLGVQKQMNSCSKKISIICPVLFQCMMQASCPYWRMIINHQVINKGFIHPLNSLSPILWINGLMFMGSIPYKYPLMVSTLSQ